MKTHIEEMVVALQALPESEQERITEIIMSEIKWTQLFNDPRSEKVLSILVHQAKEDIKAGRVKDLSAFLNEVDDNS